MFSFRRRKSAVKTRLAFQSAADDWLQLPRSTPLDTVVLQAGQGWSKAESTDDTPSEGGNGTSPSLVHPAIEPKKASRTAVDPHLVPLLTPATFEAEPYRVLSHLVGQMRAKAGLGVLAISSPSSGDGKTSVSINLAGILAQEPTTRVLLIDADLRRPSITKYLGMRHTTEGLAGMLLEQSLTFASVVQPCQLFHFDVIPAGHSSAAPYDLLKLPRFSTCIQEARAHYDYVLIDTPPLLPFADCRLIERWIDGLIVVVAAHQTPRKLLAEALEVVDPAKLVGLILNKDDYQTTRYNYAYRYYASSSKKRSES